MSQCFMYILRVYPLLLSLSIALFKRNLKNLGVFRFFRGSLVVEQTLSKLLQKQHFDVINDFLLAYC
jgi:hypothetical protein